MDLIHNAFTMTEIRDLLTESSLLNRPMEFLNKIVIII